MSFRLGIFLRNREVLIGTCSLFHLVQPCRRGQLGYGIAPEYLALGVYVQTATRLAEFCV